MTFSSALLAPLTLDEFFAERWGKQPTYIKRTNEDYFSDLISLADLDRIVTSVRIPATNLNLARGDVPLPMDAYCLSGDYVDKSAVLRHHADGATIILRSIEQWSPELNRLRAVAEDLFGCNAQINVYFTPAGEKSTPPHWDTHDLLILQIAGQKCWRLFEGARTNPLPEERFRIDVDTARDRGASWVLRAGDSLYLPGGVIHEPAADSYSVHLSIGLRRPRSLDVAAELLRQASLQQGNVLRRPLTMGSMPPLDTADLTGMFSAGAIAAAHSAVMKRWKGDRAIDLEGRLREIRLGPDIDPARTYALRLGVELRAFPKDDSLVVLAGREEVTVPVELAEAARTIGTGQAFCPATLPGPAPIEQRIAFCVALWSTAAIRYVGASHPVCGSGTADVGFDHANGDPRSSTALQIDGP